MTSLTPFILGFCSGGLFMFVVLAMFIGGRGEP